ncbi:beta-glucosidase BglX [Fulvivirga ligni]|uniref:beta-glucosidase BglX n=1 Tax=Fulvivirga ligni TaxID=2904246 RepID=UPI001F217887|nr:beta-glucosidase BglX [Fulvivirga ligni]UII20692.1 beta-glucosidase BglX [Fulvivirga ligni]
MVQKLQNTSPDFSGRLLSDVFLVYVESVKMNLKLNKKISVIAFLMTVITQILVAQDQSVDQKVENLLKKMTLEEKIGQMNQLHCADMDRVNEEMRKGHVGSILSITDPDIANKAQRVAVEESRLGIPFLSGRDVIHGFKTIFPIPLGQAATFNPEIVRQGARIAAIEASATGINWTFAPILDITHDPRWGRIAECVGEDPYLASRMAEAMVHGFQGDDLSDPTSIAACAKHFAGYGAAEGGRDYNSTFITERQFRNLYLQPFHAAVNAGTASLMAAFNDNDGIPSTANKFLLKDVLRDEWQFKGFVVSDWASVTEMIAHGFAANEKEAALRAANASLDMEMVSETYIKHLPELIEEGKVSMETIDNAVRNILRIKFELGLFDHPYVDKKRTEVFYAPDHLAAAKEAAIQSAVLLKNDNQILPLSEKVKTIAVIGPLANAPHEQLGTWVFDGDKSHSITPLRALHDQLGQKVKIIYEPALSYSRDTTTANFDKAIEAAQKADVVITFLGEEAILSGEAHSLANLNLQGKQSELLAALSETGKPVVTVIMAGRPLTIEKEVELSDVIIYFWAPGTMGGPAIVDLLFGKAVPSGKLPVTFPKSVGQIPIYYNHKNTGRPANGSEYSLNDIPVGALQTSLGNRSYYLDAGHKPLFPFGYGLSYSSFKYETPELSASKLSTSDTLSISFTLTNMGKYEATEVAQIYTQDIAGSVSRPVRELKYFERVQLKAGESKKVTFKLPVQELAFWNYDMKYVVEPGQFNLWVGGSSDTNNKTSFEVTE